jgi:hypothetical protein
LIKFYQKKKIGRFWTDQTGYCQKIRSAGASGGRLKRRHLWAMLAVWLILLAPNSSWAADPAIATPFFSIGLNDTEQSMAPTVTL